MEGKIKAWKREERSSRLEDPEPGKRLGDFKGRIKDKRGKREKLQREKKIGEIQKWTKKTVVEVRRK